MLENSSLIIGERLHSLDMVVEQVGWLIRTISANGVWSSAAVCKYYYSVRVNMLVVDHREVLPFQCGGSL